MKYTNIGKFKRLNDFIDYKMNLLSGGERTMSALYKLMFSERENVMFEESDGLIIKKTTYGEAFDAAEAKAGGFKRFVNAEKQSKVGVYMENSPEWIIVFWSLIRAGFCPVLLNTRFDDDAISRLIEELGIVAVVSDGKRFSVKTITYGETASEEPLGKEEECGKSFFVLSSGTSAVKACEYTAEELTEIILTSKYVLKNNKAIKRHYRGELKLLAFLPFYHIFGFVAVYLWFGFFSRTFVKLKDLGSSTIRNTIIRHGVTHIFAVPLFWNTVYAQAIKEIKKRGEKTYKTFEKGLKISNALGGSAAGRIFAKKAFKEIRENMFGESVRFMITGGSEISSEVTAFFNGIGYLLVNGYGMSEIGITSVELSGKRKRLIACSIGKPFPSVEYVTDSDGNLYVKGSSVAHAVYSGGKEIFSKGGLYKTADIAVKRNGFYNLLCRADDIIVSVTGENLNPVKIEEELSSSLDCDVCLINGRGGELPVLVVSVDKKASEEDVKAVTEEIKERMKKFNLVSQIGRIFVTVSELITGNEFKLGRKRIAKGYYEGRLTEWKACLRAEESEDELIEKIKTYFSEALGRPVEEIGADADFFLDEGGTSLDYFALVVKLQEDFSVPFPTEGGKSLNTAREIAGYIKEKL